MYDQTPTVTRLSLLYHFCIMRRQQSHGCHYFTIFVCSGANSHTLVTALRFLYHLAPAVTLFSLLYEFCVTRYQLSHCFHRFTRYQILGSRSLLGRSAEPLQGHGAPLSPKNWIFCKRYQHHSKIMNSLKFYTEIRKLLTRIYGWKKHRSKRLAIRFKDTVTEMSFILVAHQTKPIIFDSKSWNPYWIFSMSFECIFLYMDLKITNIFSKPMIFET